MAEQTAIDRLYEDAAAIVQILADASQTSLQIGASDHFRKALLLSAASFFEDKICNCVMSFVKENSNTILIESFVRNKAVARQYHTWFAWDKSNANQFFALFGPEFRTAMTAEVDKSLDLQSSIKAFLELGNERNSLVHRNYAIFPLDKTLDEIYALYQKAYLFVEVLPQALVKYEISFRTGRAPIG